MAVRGEARLAKLSSGTSNLFSRLVKTVYRIGAGGKGLEAGWRCRDAGMVNSFQMREHEFSIDEIILR